METERQVGSRWASKLKHLKPTWYHTGPAQAVVFSSLWFWWLTAAPFEASAAAAPPEVSNTTASSSTLMQDVPCQKYAPANERKAVFSLRGFKNCKAALERDRGLQDQASHHRHVQAAATWSEHNCREATEKPSLFVSYSHTKTKGRITQRPWQHFWHWCVVELFKYAGLLLWQREYLEMPCTLPRRFKTR